MNLGAALVLFKLAQEIGMEAVTIGPPAPKPVVTYERPSSYYYRTDGKYTFAGYRKYIDSAASGSDYQDYLTG